MTSTSWHDVSSVADDCIAARRQERLAALARLEQQTADLDMLCYLKQLEIRLASLNLLFYLEARENQEQPVVGAATVADELQQGQNW